MITWCKKYPWHSSFEIRKDNPNTLPAGVAFDASFAQAVTEMVWESEEHGKRDNFDLELRRRKNFDYEGPSLHPLCVRASQNLQGEGRGWFPKGGRANINEDRARMKTVPDWGARIWRKSHWTPFAHPLCVLTLKNRHGWPVAEPKLPKKNRREVSTCNWTGIQGHDFLRRRGTRV